MGSGKEKKNVVWKIQSTRGLPRKSQSLRCIHEKAMHLADNQTSQEVSLGVVGEKLGSAVEEKRTFRLLCGVISVVHTES